MAILSAARPARNPTVLTVSGPRAERDPRSLAPITGTETILLAEDEESVRKLLHSVLEACGYQIIEAADGREALRLFEQNPGSIDLLLTDVIMPGLNGSDLYRAASAHKPDLKVIYMSGYTGDVLLNNAACAEGRSFLRKPLKLDVLAAVIREVLDAPSVQ